MSKLLNFVEVEMALEAFNNLKEKKKANIFAAISRCLSRINYDDLSVNEIVAEAEISRGSFYNHIKRNKRSPVGSNSSSLQF